MPGRATRKSDSPAKWTHEFDTARRERLFRSPPKDETVYPSLAAAIDPHVNSFNAIFEPHGLLEQAIKEIGTRTYVYRNENRPEEKDTISLRYSQVFLEKPQLPPENKFNCRERRIFPSECRERHSTYRGRLSARIAYRVNDGEWREVVRALGSMPIMLRSNKCHLEKLSPADLATAKEETEELGGYFIVNGNERLIRLLVVNRRNYPMAIVRPSFTNRGATYTKFGVQIRSVRPDQTSQTNVLHYLNDGNVTFRFSWRKQEYLVPVMMVLNALVETNDKTIFEGIIGSVAAEGSDKQFFMDRVELLLRTYKLMGVRGKKATRKYLGKNFRPVLMAVGAMSDEEAGTEFLRKIVLPHLGCANVSESQDRDKFNMILFMIRKLYALVAGECSVDNPDAVSNQEILLGGFMYGMLLKERLEENLHATNFNLNEWGSRTNWKSIDTHQFHQEFSAKFWKQKGTEDVGSKMVNFLSTGNLASPTGLDLQQASGFTVVAEKINFFRFISHFRMVHRGSFFAELKTTTVRKLLPESWGFLCPVHTPDGAPCGLLNHLSHKCVISTRDLDVSNVPDLVRQLGATSTLSESSDDSLVVQLDGRILGYCSQKAARAIHDSLRYWKVEGTHGVPKQLEIGYVPSSNGGLYPGIYMFSQAARMSRPVVYLPLDAVDFVGPFEQPFMSIACTEDEIESGVTSHVESDPTNILSIVANQTPFSDFNQSPRNMYQCQMGKQSMGTPGTALRYRTDNKIYRLQTGQTPIVRPPLYNEYGLDNFPNGMNSVVAVISYTGYDMDDAMIINKSSHERGFGNGVIFKTKLVNLSDYNEKRLAGSKVKEHLFGFAPKGFVKKEMRGQLDEDGLPPIGKLLREGDPLCAYHKPKLDPTTKEYGGSVDGVTYFVRYKDSEDAFVEEIRLLGSENGSEPLQQVSIKLRVPRSPVIGDKFSSRHGQKGVCSQKWPSVDMPFTESGMQPDTIINPHAFPSRMTIGMFVESLAGKAGALHGLAQDSTPFRFDEQDRAVDYFGEQLRTAGYNYYGNEPMYSGITGQELAADIYVGVVYYQRLRHMVNDKYQVRTTGPVNALTGQPIKGRKKGGGIRVGEMERDALLAHGTAFLLQDRLLNCSDYARSWICRRCGGFLAVSPSVNEYASARARHRAGGPVRCRRCARPAEGWEPKGRVWEDGAGVRYVGGEDVTVVAVPSVLRYLDVELAAMGVKMRFKVEP